MQIGTDGGLLPAPIVVDHILIAMAQRVDIVIDFAQYSWCNDIIVTNDAPAPCEQPLP